MKKQLKFISVLVCTLLMLNLFSIYPMQTLRPAAVWGSVSDMITYAKNNWTKPITASYADISGARAFGGARSNGRYHAANDYVCAVGSNVYAMTSGIVDEFSSNFYGETQAISVINDDGSVARYCEISTSLRKGSRVTQGQVIGKVIANTIGGDHMLHLELYLGTTSGSLTDLSNTTYKYVTDKNYRRRSDLIDPSFVQNLPLPNGQNNTDTELGIPYPRPTGSPLIQKGSKGDGVRWVQYALQKLGYTTQYGVDGDFGSTTEAIVKQFQSANGLAADGLVGSGTITAIVAKLKGAGVDSDLGIPYPRPTGSPLIQKDSKGDGVRWVQYALQKLGYTTQYGIDGDFGSTTEAIVKQFQAANGLAADGLVGSGTINAIVSRLKSIPPNTTDKELGIPYPRPSGSPLIQKGSKGDGVRWVQYALQSLGYTTQYGIDGDFGSSTEEIVKRFQSEYGLSADGQVGPATIQKIVQAIQNPPVAVTIVTTKATTTVTKATTVSTKATTTATKATTVSTKATTTTAKVTTVSTKATTTTAKTTTTTTTTTAGATTTTTTTVTLPELSIPENAVILQPAEQYQIMPNHDNCLFSSSKPGVAVVSGRGIVTALTAGTAIISVINPDGDVVQLTVTVEPPLALEQEAVVLHPAEQYTIQPSKADCTFVSSDKSVAVVSPSGVVTALTVGTATISVISPGNETLELLVTVLDEDIIIGDCNGDGDIDVIDVVVLARFISEDPEIFISIEGRICADADRNGKLDNNDITKILRIIARLDD
ncbi:MAG: peptidoglycan-binding protein [Oscillospiraceae bacterium]|nr:peptidoglycan-binding protein [Oscillospiraceae bacterium]